MKGAKLLKITFKGIVNFPDNGFTIDFLPLANINHDEVDRDFIKLATNLYYHKVAILTGANATGKTTILELIHFALRLCTTPLFPKNYKFVSLINNELSIEMVFYDNGKLTQINYVVFISKGEIEHELKNVYQKYYVPRDKSKIYEFTPKDIMQLPPVITSSSANGSTVTLNLKTIYTMGLTSSYISALTPLNSDGLNFHTKDLDGELLELLVKVLDKNIEVFSHNNGNFNLKFFGMELETGLSVSNLFNRLSDGTKKIVLCFLNIANVIKYGGTLIIDEFENHLNKSIIDLIIDLFQDERININGANIIFSTHYAELLDEVNRSDAIFITDNENNKIVINNAYNLLKDKNKQRRELKKSKLYISGLLNSKPSYDRVNDFKKAMRKSIEDKI